MSPLSIHSTHRHVRYATYASMAVATTLIALKTYAWVSTHSLSVQATLADSLLDWVASFFNLIAVRQAQRPADIEHRFGHGKIEAISGLGQSLFISGSAAWLLFEALHRFAHPQTVEATGIGVGIMAISIALTTALLVYQRYVIKHSQSTAILADSTHYLSDLLINIGVIIVLASHGLTPFWFDPLVGILIAVYILHTAYEIANQSFHILIDRELSDEKRARILEIALAHPQVLGYHDLRTRSAGSQTFIQIHLELDGEMSLKRAHIIALEVVRELHAAFPGAEILIHQDAQGEPDEH